MKRSKIILGMSALTIAAFGAFAFSSKSMATMAEYRASDGQCLPVTVNFDCITGGENCLKPTAPDAGAQLHAPKSDCNNPLQPESGF